MANIMGSGPTTDQELEALRNMALPLMARSMGGGRGPTTDQESKAYQDAVMQMDKNQLMNYIDTVNQVSNSGATGDFSGTSVDPTMGATSGATENIGTSTLNPGATRGQMGTAIATEEQNRRNMMGSGLPGALAGIGAQMSDNPVNLLLSIGKKAANAVQRRNRPSGRRGTSGEMRRTAFRVPEDEALAEYIGQTYPDPREPDSWPPEDAPIDKSPGAFIRRVEEMIKRRDNRNIPFQKLNFHKQNKEIVMDWIKSRIVEPTTWISVGVGAILLSIIIPNGADIFMIAAAATVGAGIFMKEKGKK